MRESWAVALPIALLSLLCFIVPGSLRADAVYTYTGGTDTYCSGTYASDGTCAGNYVLSWTIDMPMECVDCGQSGVFNLTPYVKSFTVTDGNGLFITNPLNGPLNMNIGRIPEGSARLDR